jgi:excisionase family DNA binding protein
MNNEPISKPMPATLRIISAALDGDAGITPAHRRAIMEAIAKPPEAAVAAPEPVAKFYTPTEAAAICGVTLAGLLGWVRSGRMEAQRIGARNYLIPASAVDAMLASRQPATTTLRADALPDRLAHLAVVAGTVKRPRKSKRG